ncbi:MAG: hypothetical protein HON70_47710 [Lentisphaerae bacterium]|jgi:hypothetical protein|nr:hypothetical protein [Lentisphaerota bacterium]
MPKPSEHRDRDDTHLMVATKRSLTAVRKSPGRRLNMQEYLDLVQSWERPTQTQIETFIGFVSVAHSWYKHLPLHPPGVPFHFFPDPWAGCDIVVLPRGRVGARERVGDKGFHYTWMPTTEYRQKFGCLNYHARAGSSFLLGDGVVVNPRPPSPTLYTSRGPAALPESLLEAGSVSCTGVILSSDN